MSLIQLQKISLAFFERTLFDAISLQINKGDRLALIGDNGAGKTTLLKVIMGQQKADAGDVLIARDCLYGYLSQHTEELADLDHPIFDPPKRQAIQTALREIEKKLAVCSTETPQTKQLLKDYDALIRQFDTLGGYDFEAQLALIIAGLNLPMEAAKRPLKELSGGERMRAAMARLLAEKPDVLLLDEPTNHLDVAGIEWLEQYLTQGQKTVLYISHDRTFINKTATKILALNNGKLQIYPGNYDQYLIQKQREQDEARQTVKRLEAEIKRQTQVVQTLFSHRNISAYHAREKVVAKLSETLKIAKRQVDASPKSMQFQILPAAHIHQDKQLILQIQSLSKHFGDRLLFNGVELELHGREKICIVGPNGCGKSTLMRILTGQDSQFSGTYRLSSTLTCGYLGQHVQFEDETCTILDEIDQRVQLGNTAKRQLLARYGFWGESVYKRLNQLSGGERVRLYLCCMLEEHPDLLFLDEPTNHLDIQSKEILESALQTFDGAILGISHDRYLIDHLADRILGYINQSFRLFDSYTQYRQSYAAEIENQKSAQQLNHATAAELKRSQKKQDNENRQTRRKAAAQQRQSFKQLEAEIQALETEIATITDDITPDTTPDTYKALADLQQLLEKAYADYFALGEQLEASASDSDNP